MMTVKARELTCLPSPSDPLFLTLYKELYYRHIYAKLAPTVDQRFESYENYCDLFNYILGVLW